MKVTVCVPVRNEEATLQALLDSLFAQTLPPDEIVLADGGSTDATVPIARRHASRGVRTLEIGPAYPGRGRNEAIRAAANEWVALIDAGCVADPGWLEALVGSQKGCAEGAVVFGEHRASLESEWDVAQALAFLGPPDPQTKLHPPVVASCLLSRSVWEKVGGFPEELRAAEDLLFMRKLTEAGCPVVRSPALVRWRLPKGPGAVFKRFRSYSAHHLAAGLFTTWHLRVMLIDSAFVMLGVASLLHPVFGLGFVGLGSARVLRTVARRAWNVSLRPYRPDRLLRVTFLLLVADVACWLGLVDHLLRRGPRK